MSTRKSIDEKFFAELYLKDQGIEYNRCWANYADLGNSYSYISIGWEDKKDKMHSEQIGVMDAFNLMSKYVLERNSRIKKI